MDRPYRNIFIVCAVITVGAGVLRSRAAPADSRPEEECDGCPTTMSGRQPIHQPRKRNHLPHVRPSRNPCHRTFQPESKPRVGEGSVPP